MFSSKRVNDCVCEFALTSTSLPDDVKYSIFLKKGGDVGCFDAFGFCGAASLPTFDGIAKMDTDEWQKYARERMHVSGAYYAGQLGATPHTIGVALNTSAWNAMEQKTRDNAEE